MIRGIKGLVAMAVLAGATGCVRKAKNPDEELPKFVHIYLAVSDDAADQDTVGGLGSLVNGIDDELRENGYRPVLVGARPDEAPPVPRIEVRVLSFKSGDVKGRNVAQGVSQFVAPVGLVMQAGASSGSFWVDCYFVRDEKSKPVYTGRFSGGGNPDAAERVGRGIAKRLMD